MPENLSSDKINVVFWEEWCFSCPQKIMKLLKDGLFVNYDEKDLGLLSAEGILHWGEYQTYLISQPSWVDKYSLRYVNCLGMIASWRTFFWEIYSLLSHQDTEVMLKNSYREKVKKDLVEQLVFLKQLTIEESIDIVVFWGNLYLDSGRGVTSYFDSCYENGLKIIHTVVKEVLGFSPRILHAPKQEWGHNDAFFHTAENTLYLFWDVGSKELKSSYLPFTYEELWARKKEWEHHKHL